jgi:hypothetical protein
VSTGEDEGRTVTHVDNHVDGTVSLLLEDTVGRPDEETPSLKEINLL